MADFKKIFAKNGILQPITDADYEGGWVDIVGSNPPETDDFNSVMNEQDTKINEIARYGVVNWDAGIPYQAKALSRSPVDDEVYQLLPSGDPTNEPSVSPADWIALSVAYGESPGFVKAFASSSVPSGYLECNGADISRTVYSNLFSVLGTQWGIGDGSTTFNIPDFRGEFLRGWDNGRGVDSGRLFASFQGFDIQSHSHLQRIYPDQTGASVGPSNDQSTGGVITTSLSTEASGGSETRPRNAAIMFCIRY